MIVFGFLKSWFWFSYLFVMLHISNTLAAAAVASRPSTSNGKCWMKNDISASEEKNSSFTPHLFYELKSCALCKSFACIEQERHVYWFIRPNAHRDNSHTHTVPAHMHPNERTLSTQVSKIPKIAFYLLHLQSQKHIFFQTWSILDQGYSASPFSPFLLLYLVMQCYCAALGSYWDFLG